MERNADTLKGWLKRVGAYEKGLTRKDHYIQAIERHLAKNLAGVLALMSEEERNLLAESAHQGSLISAREFTAKYGGKCPQPKAYYGYRDEISLLEPFIERSRYRDELPDMLAESLIEPLRALLPKPGPVRVEIVDSLPSVWPSERDQVHGEEVRPLHVFESERVAPAELARVLRLIQGGKVKVTDVNRRPTDVTTRLVREALSVPDFELDMPAEHVRPTWRRTDYEKSGAVRAHAWPVLVRQCGWAKSKAGVLNLTAAGKQILGQFTPVLYREGVKRFLSNDDFDELHRVNHLRGQTGKAKRYLSDPMVRKGITIEAMELFPVGQWLAYEEARRLINAWEMDWDVVEAPQPTLYFGRIEYRAILEMLATPKGDMVWALDAELMLTHLETGGAFADLRAFLEDNAADGLPANVQVFLAGLEAKSTACLGCRDAVLVEWADEALAQLVATSAAINKLCHHAGGNRVVVPGANFGSFARAVKKLGYVVPPRK